MAIQKTIGRAVGLSGIGLHSGAWANVTLHPAWPGSGLILEHRGMNKVIPVELGAVRATARATTLGLGTFEVSTVEHLLAAVTALGVTNLRIEVDAFELPVLDGSALPWVDLIRSAGVVTQNATIAEIVVRAAVRAGDERGWVSFEPAPALSVDVAIDFEAAAVGRQRFSSVVSDDEFAQRIAPARTFGFLHEVPGLRAAGLGRGGSLDCCIVVDGARVLSGALRFPDEFARHKALDLIGNLALLEHPLRARVRAHRAGHALHVQALEALLGRPDAWELVEHDRLESLTVRPADLDAEALA